MHYGTPQPPRQHPGWPWAFPRTWSRATGGKRKLVLFPISERPCPRASQAARSEGGHFRLTLGEAFASVQFLAHQSDAGGCPCGFSLRRDGDEGRRGWGHRRVRQTEVHRQREAASLQLRIHATKTDRRRNRKSRAIRAGGGRAGRGGPRGAPPPTARPFLQGQAALPIFRPLSVSFPSACLISAPPCLMPRPWTWVFPRSPAGSPQGPCSFSARCFETALP